MAGLDGCGKSRLHWGFDPRTVQPVANRYTDWATAAHMQYTGSLYKEGIASSRMFGVFVVCVSVAAVVIHQCVKSRSSSYFMGDSHLSVFRGWQSFMCVSWAVNTQIMFSSKDASRRVVFISRLRVPEERSAEFSMLWPPNQNTSLVAWFIACAYVKWLQCPSVNIRFEVLMAVGIIIGVV
jgi:hypothetical protein